MKIVVFTIGFGSGGAERVMVLLANQWNEQGNKVEFWVIRERGPRRKELNKDITVRELSKGIRGVQRFTLPRAIRKLIQEQRPDILYCTLTYANCLCGSACRGLSDPPRLVLREANSFENLAKGGKMMNAVMRYWMRKSYRHADVIIANAANVQRDLKSKVIRGESPPVKLIPNPVMLEPRDTSELAIQQPRPGVKRILGCGRLIPQKGFDVLIKACAALPSTLDWELVLLGEGPERKALEELAENLKVNSCIKIAGYVEDVRAWYRGADLFVLSSHWEGFPNVLVEAMACGIPVLATDCPGACREILYLFPDLLFEVGNARELTEKICDVLVKEMKVDTLALKEVIKNQYELSAIAKQYLNIGINI